MKEDDFKGKKKTKDRNAEPTQDQFVQNAS
jgi:hypothetical protein